MPNRTGLLLAILLAAAPLVAAEPPFATELAVVFGYEGSATDRPLVVLDGMPSASYDYSADGKAHVVDVAVTRWFSPVGDDGLTPLALLPFVARASSATARFALTGESRDSFGSFSGQETSLQVRLSGDGSLRESDLSAEWFFGRSLSVRGGFEYGDERETAGTRSSGSTGLLGVALRLGEHEVSATGRYGKTDLTREDASAFTGSAQPFFSALTSEGIVRRATLGTRLLFLDRRLLVEASGSYALTTSSSDLATSYSGPFAQGRVLTRDAAVEATWFATRRLGLSAGFGYGTQDVSSGSPERLRPSRSDIGRTLSARLRWFASERVSVVLAGSRSQSEETAPPDSTTYQRFDETIDRVTLGAALRF